VAWYFWNLIDVKISKNLRTSELFVKGLRGKHWCNLTLKIFNVKDSFNALNLAF
jgi:hypothetical protein